MLFMNKNSWKLAQPWRRVGAILSQLHTLEQKSLSKCNMRAKIFARQSGSRGTVNWESLNREQVVFARLVEKAKGRGNTGESSREA